MPVICLFVCLCLCNSCGEAVKPCCRVENNHFVNKHYRLQNDLIANQTLSSLCISSQLLLGWVKGHKGNKLKKHSGTISIETIKMQCVFVCVCEWVSDSLSELCISQQLLHHGSLPGLLGNPGMIEVHWIVHHCANLPTHVTHHDGLTAVFFFFLRGSDRRGSSPLATHLEILGEAVSVVLLVEPLRVQRASHLQDLQVSFQLIGQLRSLHVEPGLSCRFGLLLLTRKK